MSAEPLVIQCTGCGKRFKGTTALIGRLVKCPACATTFRVPTADAPAPEPQPAPVAAPPAPPAPARPRPAAPGMAVPPAPTFEPPAPPEPQADYGTPSESSSEYASHEGEHADAGQHDGYGDTSAGYAETGEGHGEHADPHAGYADPNAGHDAGHAEGDHAAEAHHEGGEQPQQQQVDTGIGDPSRWAPPEPQVTSSGRPASPLSPGAMTPPPPQAPPSPTPYPARPATPPDPMQQAAVGTQPVAAPAAAVAYTPSARPMPKKKSQKVMLIVLLVSLAVILGGVGVIVALSFYKTPGQLLEGVWRADNATANQQIFEFKFDRSTHQVFTRVIVGPDIFPDDKPEMGYWELDDNKLKFIRMPAVSVVDREFQSWEIVELGKQKLVMKNKEGFTITMSRVAKLSDKGN